MEVEKVSQVLISAYPSEQVLESVWAKESDRVLEIERVKQIEQVRKSVWTKNPV